MAEKWLKNGTTKWNSHSVEQKKESNKSLKLNYRYKMVHEKCKEFSKCGQLLTFFPKQVIVS